MRYDSVTERGERFSPMLVMLTLWLAVGLLVMGVIAAVLYKSWPLLLPELHQQTTPHSSYAPQHHPSHEVVTNGRAVVRSKSLTPNP